jgi:hypothetical protein
MERLLFLSVCILFLIQQNVFGQEGAESPDYISGIAKNLTKYRNDFSDYSEGVNYCEVWKLNWFRDSADKQYLNAKHVYILLQIFNDIDSEIEKAKVANRTESALKDAINIIEADVNGINIMVGGTKMQNDLIFTTAENMKSDLVELKGRLEKIQNYMRQYYKNIVKSNR